MVENKPYYRLLVQITTFILLFKCQSHLFSCFKWNIRCDHSQIFLLISYPMKILLSESLILTVPHKSHIMQSMQSCGNKDHAILKQLPLNARDCQICISQRDCGSFITVCKPGGSNILSVRLADWHNTTGKGVCKPKEKGPFGGTALCCPFLEKHTLDLPSFRMNDRSAAAC